MSPLSQQRASRFQSIDGALRDIPREVNDLIAEYDDSPPTIVSLKLIEITGAMEVLRELSYHYMNKVGEKDDVFKGKNHYALKNEEFLKADFLLRDLNIYLVYEWLQLTWWKIQRPRDVEVRFITQEHFAPSARLTLKLASELIDWEWNLDGCQKFWGSPTELSSIQFGTYLIPTHNFLFNTTDFDGTVFRNCSFSQIEFDSSYLLNSKFFDCRFISCRFITESFTSVKLKDCSFKACFFDNYKFGSSVIEGTQFTNCKFRTLCPDSGAVKSDSDTVEFSSVTFQNTSFEWSRIPFPRTVAPQILTRTWQSNFKVIQDRRPEPGDKFQSLCYKANGFVETAKIGCPVPAGISACTIQ